jgi:hypothetical protein
VAGTGVAILEKLRSEAGKNTEMERRNNFGDMDCMTPVQD